MYFPQLTARPGLPLLSFIVGKCIITLPSLLFGKQIDLYLSQYSDIAEEVKKAREIMPYEICEGPHNDVRIKVQNSEYSLSEISAIVLTKMKHK